MKNRPISPGFTTNRWFKLGVSLLLAMSLAVIILLIPMTRNKSIQVATLADNESIEITLPLGAELVYAASGLTITKFATPADFVDQGGLITYTLIVENISENGTIEGLTVRDPLPENIICDASDPNGVKIYMATDNQDRPWLPKNEGIMCNEGQAEWLFVELGDSFAIGDRVELQYRLVVDEPLRDREDAIVNDNYRIDVLTPSNVIPPTIGEDVVTNLVNAPKWDISKVAVPDAIQPGDDIVYDITVANIGHLATEGPFTVTDKIPAFTTFTPGSATPTETSFDGATITWRLTDTLDVNDSVPLVYTVTADSILTDDLEIVNQAYSVTGGNVFSEAFGSPVTVTVDAPVTLTLTKTPDPNPFVDAGGTIFYTILIANNSDSKGPASDVVIVDTIPANTTLLDAGFSPGTVGTVTTSSITVTWRLTNPIPVDNTASVTMSVLVDAPLENETEIINQYEVTVSNNSIPPPDTVTTTVVSAPILDIVKTDDPSVVIAGEQLTYTIAFSNSGNANATNVVVVDTLDDFVRFISSDPPANSTPPAGTFGGTVVWNRPPLGGVGPDQEGSTGLLTVTVEVSRPLPVGTILTNTAEINTAEDVTDSTTITTDVRSQPDIQISKSVVPTPTVEAGGLLTYSLTISNVGNANALDVILSDAIPVNTSFESATSGISPTNPAPGTPITWSVNILEVSPQPPQVFTFTVRVDNPLPEGTTIVNSANLSSVFDNKDSNTVTTTVVSTPTLEIFKIGLPDSVEAGEPLTYTIRYTNTGNADTSNVVIRDTFPLETEYISDNSDPDIGPGDTSTTGITWTIPSIAGNNGGGVITLTLLTKAPQDDGTTLTNTVSIEATQPKPTSDTFTATNTISSTPNLQISKAASTDLIEAGQNLVYTITFTNSGNMDATGVVITDTYNGPFATISASSGATVITTPLPARIVWDIGVVPANTFRTEFVTITIPRNIADGSILTNDVLITSDQGVTDNDSIAIPAEALMADLSIFKDGEQNEEIVVGTPVTYTITITNNGFDTVNAVITDTFTNASLTINDIIFQSTYNAVNDCTVGASGFVCELGNFTGTNRLTVVLDTTNSTPGVDVTNGVEIQPTDNAVETNDTDNNSDGPPVPVRAPRADLSVQKDRIGTGEVVIGDTIVYSLTIGNPFTDPITAILTDTFTNAGLTPNNIVISPTYAGADCAVTLTPPDGQFVCTFPNFVEDQRIVLVTLSTNASDPSNPVTNSAEIGSTPNVDEQNNTDNNSDGPPVDLRFPTADLTIVKTLVSTEMVVIDAPITYRLTITNKKGSDTVTAIITDTFSNAGFGSLTIDPPYSPGNCVLNGSNSLVCTLPNFTNTINIDITLDTATSISGTVTNSAQIGSDGNTVEVNDVDNQSDGPDVKVRLPVADLQVDKSTALTEVLDGGLINYTIVVTNVGGDIVDAVVVDSFDTSLASFFSCNDCTGSGPVTWAINDFLPDTQITLDLVLKARFGVTGTLTNNVSVDFDKFGVDNETGNNIDSADVFIRFVPKLVYLPIILKNFPPPLPTPTLTPTPTGTPVPGGTDTPTPSITPTGTPPTPIPLSDLVITSFSISPADPTSSDNVVVTIVVQNNSPVTTGEGFWTDFYVNPVTLPNDPNLGRDRGWYNEAVNSLKGIAWQVPTLGPGESIILTSDGSGGGLAPSAPQTDWTAPQLLPGNYILYAFVDSFDRNDPTGDQFVEIIETNENNNLAGPINITIPGAAQDVESNETPPQIEPRPDAGQ